MGTKRKAPIKAATKKPAAKAKLKPPVLRDRSRKVSEGAVIAAAAMRAVETNRLQRRSPALAFGFAGVLLVSALGHDLTPVGEPEVVTPAAVLPVTTALVESPAEPVIEAAPAAVESDNVTPLPDAVAEEPVVAPRPVVAEAHPASTPSRDDELTIWASVPAVATIAARMEPTLPTDAGHAERPQIAIPQQADVPRPGQADDRVRGASNERPAPRVKPDASANAALASANPLIAEARRYLGTNPTGRASLWCGAFLDMVLKRVGYKGGGNLAAAYAKYGIRVAGPQIGAIAVMYRQGGGHVGIVTGFDANGNPVIISGNYRKRVAEVAFPRGRIYAYVVPSQRVVADSN